MISILYVDDEPLFLDLGKRFLEKSGKIQVDTFLSAEIAIKLLPFSLYDAIISDYLMPDMDGIEFLSAVRDIQPDIPFIVYTGKGGEEIAIQALNHGADFYLQKGGKPKIEYDEMEKFILNIVGREHRKGEILAQKRKAEEALSLLQTLYEYAPFGFAFVDTNFVFIHVNDALSGITGVPRGEHLGRTLEEVNLRLWGLISSKVHHVLQTGEAILDFEVNGKTILKTGNETEWLINLYPVRTKEKEILGIGILIVDISARKVMEYVLAESEERYRTLAESALDAIFIIGRDERVTYINSFGAQILHQESGSLVGRRIDDPQTSLYNLIQLPSIRSVFSTGLKCSYDTKISSSDGQIWVEILLIPMPGFHNPSGQVMGIGRDVTRRKIAESGLLSANRKLNLLSSITRHDIINQLSFLFIYLEDLKEYISSDPPGQEIFVHIKQAIQTIHQQIEFTREYQEIGVKVPVWQNLHQILQKTVQSLPLKEIKVEENDTDLEVLADSLFEKVIYNLIENAIRYGEKITRIRCYFEGDGEIGRIILEDNGVGIPDSDKEKIFSFGFGDHTGFGLFMAHEILSITNMNIRENGIFLKGAHFEITLPPGFFRPPEK